MLRLIDQGRWRLNISVALALEYEDVLKREGLLTGIDAADVDELLEYLFAAANLAPSRLASVRVCAIWTTSVFWKWQYSGAR